MNDDRLLIDDAEQSISSPAATDKRSPEVSCYLELSLRTLDGVLCERAKRRAPHR